MHKATTFYTNPGYWTEYLRQAAVAHPVAATVLVGLGIAHVIGARPGTNVNGQNLRVIPLDIAALSVRQEDLLNAAVVAGDGELLTNVPYVPSSFAM